MCRLGVWVRFWGKDACWACECGFGVWEWLSGVGSGAG